MDSCLLFLLPTEVLKYIGSFLHPRDLLAVSETCHILRAAFNDDLIWRRYTDGGHLSRRLDNIPSVVHPLYSYQQLDIVDPLCQHRLHFMKQSRLLYNLRQGKCVKHSIPFDGYLTDIETLTALRSREVIYAEEYLFSLDYNDELHEVINIFNIKAVPYLFMTFELEKHVDEYSIIICQQVINDKLVVRQENWIDVYQINFPSRNIPLLRSFCIDQQFQPTYEVTLGHFLFYSCPTLNIVRIWNFDILEQCKDIRPKIDGQDFRVLSCSDNFKLILLCAKVARTYNVCLFVYNMVTQSYTNFDIAIPIKNYDFCGLIEDSFVVIVSEKNNVKCSVHVYNIELSTEIATKYDLDLSCLNYVKIKNGHLFLPTHFSILILKLTDLQVVHELHFDTNSLIPEIPQHCLRFVEYIHFSNLCLMIVIGKSNETEIWNYEKMSKILVLPYSCSGVTNTVSKLIICGMDMLTVANYW